jgi:hypothetical protein
MPAASGRRRGIGPAYGNRPSTNPRGTGAKLWGFESCGATVWVVRWFRSAIYFRPLVMIGMRERVRDAMRRRQTDSLICPSLSQLWIW